MSKSDDAKYDEVLDEETLQMLGSAPESMDLPSERMSKLRARVMQRIDEEGSPVRHPFVTIRSYEGPWIEIAPKIEKKVLHINHDTGTESYLLRVQPGAEAPAHGHAHDELCLVLEGEVTFDDIHLEAGDWHFAPKGSQHGQARSESGAILFIQTGLEGTSVAL